MDHLASIKRKKDSTLAMLVAAQTRGWQIFVIYQSDMCVENGVVIAAMQEVTVHESRDPWYMLKEPLQGPLNNLDVVLMRKEPPFNMEYIYTTYMLEMAEQAGLKVLNRPSSIRDCNEKMFALQFPQCCPPHLVTRDPERLRHFYHEHGDVIFKPLDGMGGTSIFRLKADDPNLSVVIETLTVNAQRQIMAQKFIPEIKYGDTRILLINGEPVPYGLARIPAKGETRGNLSAGGQGVARPLNERDYWICQQVASTLKAKGLYFVGIDVIGDYLTEINVTCPTCIREINQAYQIDIAGDYVTFIESLMS